MGKDKGAKRNKKPGKLRDLPAKAKRASAVKGGVISGNQFSGIHVSGSAGNDSVQ